MPEPAATLAALDWAPTCSPATPGRCSHAADVAVLYSCGHVALQCRWHATRLQVACSRATVARRVYLRCATCDRPLSVACLDMLDLDVDTDADSSTRPK